MNTHSSTMEETLNIDSGIAENTSDTHSSSSEEDAPDMTEDMSTKPTEHALFYDPMAFLSVSLSFFLPGRN